MIGYLTVIIYLTDIYSFGWYLSISLTPICCIDSLSTNLLLKLGFVWFYFYKYILSYYQYETITINLVERFPLLNIWLSQLVFIHA